MTILSRWDFGRSKRKEGIKLSNREMIINLIEDIPEYKLSFVVDIIKSLKGLIDDVESVEPDDIDLAMIKEAEEINDGKGIDLEDLAKELNIDV